MLKYDLRSNINIVAVAAIVFISTLASYAQKWEPVPAEDLALKSSTVEPNADAEVLFWDVRVDDGHSTDLIMNHYVRAKIFTEKGREKYSKVDIPFNRRMRIRNIKARVIKPDGTIVDLEKNDVFDQEIVRADKVKVRAKSFAVPGIDIGVIVEYQYQEVYKGTSAEDMRMVFQQDVPIRKKSYYFRPAADARVLTYNMADGSFQKDKGGFYRKTLENIPSLKEEPYMPPEDEVRSWMLVYYPRRLKDEASDFWARYGGYLVAVYDVKRILKPGKEIRAKAQELATGANAPLEKLRRLHDFCKTGIKNIDYDTRMTDDERDEIKPNKNPADTLKKAQGTTGDINELFASLAAALGMEVRLAFSGDRSEKFFHPQDAHESFIHFAAASVLIDNRWHYFSPGDYFVPFGMLKWQEEGTAALLLEQKTYLTVTTPMSSPNASKVKRTGNLKLSENGDLEGTVKMEYTGQYSAQYKLDNYKSSENKREEDLKDFIRSRMSTAEISDISIQNVDDPEKPFTYIFKIRVPGYAQKVGRRLLFQPAFFQNGSAPAFTSSDRKYEIFFQYPWSHEDEVTLELPAGYGLEGPEVPDVVRETSGITELKYQLSTHTDGSKILYKRDFYFGGRGNILFPASSYPAVKQMFDRFHEADTRQMTLIQK